MASAASTDRGVTRFARRGSARLSYEAAGEPVQPAAVALHDLLADRSGFAGLRDALVRRGFCVLLPDARGHGVSAALSGGPYGLVELTADVAALLDAEGIARAHLIGHGLGGAVALETARLTPERVASLTLIEPAVAGILAAAPDPAGRWAAARLRDAARDAAAAAGKGQTDRAVDVWLDLRLGAGWRERLPRERLAAIRRHAGALASILGAADARSPAAEELAALFVPVLVVRREEADLADRTIGERLVATMPNARLEVLAVAGEPDGSILPAEEIVSARVAGFLEEVERGRAPRPPLRRG